MNIGEREFEYNFPVHPIANAVRMMDDDEFEGLVELIAEHGLLDPITIGVLNGERFIVDGRCRLKACEIAGVEPRFKEKEFAGEDDLIDFFVARNGVRHYINKGQRAMLHALFFPEPPSAKDRGAKGGRGNKALGSGNSFSKELLSKARAVLAYSRPLALQVHDGTKPLNDAYQQVQMEKAENERRAEKTREIRAAAADIVMNVDEGRLEFSEGLAIFEQRKADALARIWKGRATIAQLAQAFAEGVEAIADALTLSRWPNRITADEARSIRLEDIESSVKRLREVVGAFLEDGAPRGLT